MKSLIEKLKALRIFKHDCLMNKTLVACSYLKDGGTGVIFLTGKEYRCKKCGKRWSDNEGLGFDA